MDDIVDFFSNSYSNSKGNPYDFALICQNGHVINEMVNQCPDDNKNYCEICGSKAISKCEACGKDIRGNRPGDIYTPPSFCNNCGKVFPWVQSRIEAAIELSLESDNISEDDKETFKESLGVVIRDTPRTALGATKIKKILFKIGNGTSKMIRDLIVSIISETAKKIIWPEK